MVGGILVIAFALHTWAVYGGSTLTHKCGKRCYHVKVSQFARKAFSCLYMGVIVDSQY